MFRLVRQRIRFYLIILIVVIPAQGIKRTIGPPNDQRFVRVSRTCNATTPEAFEFRICSDTIDCVYNHLSEGFKANLASGTSIVALLPTILALIGAPPLEIVQLALISPHRALATCCFAIGLPNGLFRQLRPLHTHLSTVNPREPRTRQWIIPLSSFTSGSWKSTTAKICMDLLILALASIMLWRNWLVSSFTMIPWRCEYSWLVFAWPLACMTWLILAVLLVLGMKESIQVYDGYDQKLNYGILGLISIPYLSTQNTASPPIPPPIAVHNPEDETSMSNLRTINTGASASSQSLAQIRRRPSLPTHTSHRSETITSYNNSYIRVCITMPTNFGFRSWRWYEAIIESLALGIYLYATFVMTSIMFLSADKAIGYATVMATCLSAVRVLATQF